MAPEGLTADGADELPAGGSGPFSGGRRVPSLFSCAASLNRKQPMRLEYGTAADDPAAIADLIWETDPEMCQFVFADRGTWHRRCAIEWRAEIGLHASSSATVAWQESEIAGLAIAFPQSEMASRYAATVARYETGIGQRMETVGWLFPILPEKALYVFNLAVLQPLRGQGIGRQLLSAVEEQAQQASLTAVHLDVPATSPAVKFYEQMGYGKLTKTELLEPKTMIPPHFRMHKRIAADR
jgi:ribosomal protein S18 acetylase RimI-like enzyme